MIHDRPEEFVVCSFEGTNEGTEVGMARKARTEVEAGPEKKGAAQGDELMLALAGVKREAQKAGTLAAASALAVELGIRTGVVLKAAERAGGWRDEKGVLWVGPAAHSELARHLARTLAHVERMAERAKKRWRPLEAGCEVMRVEQIPGRHTVVQAVRLGHFVAGEKVTVEVRDSLAYRVGEEIVAKKGAWGYRSQEGR
jgi:hypothetical protein